MDELKKFPNTNSKLKTKKGNAFFQKMDIFSNKMWYSYKDEPHEFIELSLDRVKTIIDVNKKGQLVEELKDHVEREALSVTEYANVVGQDDLNRFDHKKRRNRNQRRKKPFKKKSNSSN